MNNNENVAAITPWQPRLFSRFQIFFTIAINSHGNTINPILFLHRASHKPCSGSSWGRLSHHKARVRAQEYIDICFNVLHLLHLWFCGGK